MILHPSHHIGRRSDRLTPTSAAHSFTKFLFAFPNPCNKQPLTFRTPTTQQRKVLTQKAFSEKHLERKTRREEIQNCQYNQREQHNTLLYTSLDTQRTTERGAQRWRRAMLELTVPNDERRAYSLLLTTARWQTHTHTHIDGTATERMPGEEQQRQGRGPVRLYLRCNECIPHMPKPDYQQGRLRFVLALQRSPPNVEVCVCGVHVSIYSHEFGKNKSLPKLPS